MARCITTLLFVRPLLVADVTMIRFVVSVFVYGTLSMFGLFSFPGSMLKNIIRNQHPLKLIQANV